MSRSANHYSLSEIKLLCLPLLSQIKNPHLELSLIIQFVTSLTKSQYISSQNIAISEKDFSHIHTLVEKRASGTPMAYIIGKKDFFDSSIQVNSHVLIPRPETEDIVEKTIHFIEKIQEQNPKDIYNSIPLNIIDCGTGSGCIGISLAQYLLSHAKKKWHITLSDISTDALECARQNSIDTFSIEDKNSLQIDSSPCHISASLSLSLSLSMLLEHVHSIPYGIIVANLPYVCTHHFQYTPLSHEPKTALHGYLDSGMQYSYSKNITHYHTPNVYNNTRYAHDGLDIMNLLFSHTAQYSHTHMLLLEADPIQFDSIRAYASEYQYNIQGIIWDLQYHPRFFYCIRE